MRAFGVSNNFIPDAAAMAALGGAVLGATVAFKTGVTGEVLGVSGSTRGIVARVAHSAEKVAFILGLVGAGATMAHVYGGFERVPAPSLALASTGSKALYFARLGLGGLFVGFGTALGNGCTSGHGLTGLARLSLRSWVAVPTFMAVAALTATVLGTASAFPAQVPLTGGTPTVALARTWAAGLVATILIGAGIAAGLRRYLGAGEAQRMKPVAELVAGYIFGCALSISTMTRPSKVAGFLDLGSGAWDPSLMFVMCGALLITTPFFQILERQPSAAPLLGGGFGMPPASKPVDRNLVLGAAMFGLGWGTCGMCPGPIWVVVGAVPSLEVGIVAGGMVLGMAAWAYGPSPKPCQAREGEEGYRRM